MTALHEAHDMALPEPTILARMAHRIDHEFIGLRCGIMDHMVCAVGAPGAAMMLDCRSMEYSLHAFPADHTFLVIHSGSGRKLSEGQYNERVAECEGACQALGIYRFAMPVPKTCHKFQMTFCSAVHGMWFWKIIV